MPVTYGLAVAESYQEALGTMRSDAWRRHGNDAEVVPNLGRMEIWTPDLGMLRSEWYEIREQGDDHASM